MGIVYTKDADGKLAVERTDITIERHTLEGLQLRRSQLAMNIAIANESHAKQVAAYADELAAVDEKLTEAAKLGIIEKVVEAPIAK